MRAIRVVSAAMAVVMAATIVYGFAAGDFGDEGGMILDLAWGRVTLIDLYVGLVLFGGWIVLRERGPIALAWIAGLVVLGNLTAAVYAFIAAMRSETVPTFLLGPDAKG